MLSLVGNKRIMCLIGNLSVKQLNNCKAIDLELNFKKTYCFSQEENCTENFLRLRSFCSIGPVYYSPVTSSHSFL